MPQDSRSQTGGGDTFNQTGWTSGSHGTMIGRDQNNIFYGQREDGSKVEVDYSNEKPSMITTRASGIVAVISNLITIGTFAQGVWAAWNAWPALEGYDPVTAIWLTSAALYESVMPSAVALLFLTAFTVWAWRFYHARKRQFPIYYRRWSLRRALLPSRTREGGFARVTARAECTECAKDNRPGQMGKLFKGKGDRDGTVSYRCKNGHLSKFRGRSIFAS